MAAITPTSVMTDDVLGATSDTQNYHQGYRYMRIPFMTNTVDNGDTWDSGMARISSLAWEADASADQVAVGRNGSLVNFSASGSGNQGYVHVWGTSNSTDVPNPGTVTPDDFTMEEVLEGITSDGVSLLGCQRRRFEFTTSGTSPDTWTHGLEGVVAMSWASSDGTTDISAVELTDEIILFTYSAGTPSGALNVWTRGR